jgi:hypothetical protein
MKYLADLDIDMETAEFLVPLEIVQAPAFGEMTKDGFVEGWRNVAGYCFVPPIAGPCVDARILVPRPIRFPSRRPTFLHKSCS